MKPSVDKNITNCQKNGNTNVGTRSHNQSIIFNTKNSDLIDLKDNLNLNTEIDNNQCSNELSDEFCPLGKDEDFGNEAKKRRRKSNIQLRILKNELDNDENWSKEKIFKVSKLTGLSESQVYKWCWDQKKKRDDIDAKKQKTQFNNNGKLIFLIN